MRIFNMNVQFGGVSEYRHFVPSRALVRDGHQVTFFEVAPFPANMERFVLDHMRDYDVMHVGYVVDEKVLRTFAASRNYAQIPLITDIDDDIEHVPKSNKAYPQYHGGAQERKITRMQLRISDGVSISTQPLLDVLAPNVKIGAVLPNCFDPESWDGVTQPNRGEDKSIRLLIAGSHGHFDDYLEVKDCLEWAMDKFNGQEGKPLLRLFFVGFVPDWAEKWMPSTTLPTANRAFMLSYASPVTYRQMIQWVRPDIILAPLQTNEFNLSKSHIKAYDAAMGGAAFMCTDYRTYECIPEDCCLKVSNTMVQWREGLNALITDASLRLRLHQHLKEYVFDVWPIDKHIHKWVEFYHRVREAPLVNSLEDVVRPA